jgi:hypothetical protein
MWIEANKEDYKLGLEQHEIQLATQFLYLYGKERALPKTRY